MSFAALRKISMSRKSIFTGLSVVAFQPALPRVPV